MKRSHVQNFVVYSTLVMIFGTKYVIWTDLLVIQAFYFLIPVNLFLMLLLRRLWFPVQLLYIFAAIAGTCCIGLVQGTDTLYAFTKQAIGIMTFLVYFCSFFRMIDFDLTGVFRQYSRLAFYVVVYGLVSFPYMALVEHEPRLRSVLGEPSAFAITCLPAFYYYAHVFQKTRTGGYKVALFALAFLLANSSNGFLAILFGVFIFGRRYKLGALLAVPVAVLVAVLTYTFSENFETRLDDTFVSLANQDVRGANLSSVALYANIFVTEEVLKRHPLFGDGLGSHGLSYDKYAYNLPGVDHFIDTPMERLNAEDGSSFLVRTLSDMGIIGAGAILFGVWYFRPKGRDEISYMCEGILVYFFLKFLRGGQYFSNEQYFFVLIYFLRPFYVRLQQAQARANMGVEATAPTLQLAPGL